MKGDGSESQAFYEKILQKDLYSLGLHMIIKTELVVAHCWPPQQPAEVRFFLKFSWF